MKTSNTNSRVAIFSRALTAAALLTGAVVLTVPTTALAGGDKTTQIIPPNQEAYGTSYSELAGAWWNWALNQPPDTNPILDETGAFAAVGQDEDWGQGKKVFFLAGNFGGETVRDATVPKGKALFFPLVNQFFITPEEGNIDEVRAFANAGANATSVLECTIDGEPVGDLFAYRAQSVPGGSPFEVRAGSFAETLGVPPRGPEPAVADGYWLLLELGGGKEHVIEFAAKAGDPATPDFELSVTYHLTVVDDEDDQGEDE